MLALETDDLMRRASRACMQGLAQFDAGVLDAGLANLAQGMEQAHEAFLRWELVPAEALRMREQQLREGAISARLTGAGGGGFVVALWK